MQETKHAPGVEPPDGAQPTKFARLTLALGYVIFTIGVLAFLAVVLPGPLYRIRALSLGAAFHSITYGAYVGIPVIVLSVILLPVTWIARHKARSLILPAVALILGGVAWGVPYSLLRKAESVPPIHDITTDTKDPPQFLPDVVALRAATHAANSTVYGGAKIAAQQKKAYPYIQPMVFKLPVSKVFSAALQASRAMGWKLDSEHPDMGIIEASSTTFWFGFTDDVVIRIQPASDGTRLDIRSESRIGESDIGHNAARIMRFRAMLYEKLGLPLPAR